MIKGRFFVAEKKRRECRQEDGKKTFFATASRNLVAKIKSLYSVFYCKGLIFLERETRFELATFSLEAEYMHLEELVADTLVRTLKDIL